MTTNMQHLPPEIRMQILSQLPLSSLLNLRFLSRYFYNDVEALFCTRRFVMAILERVHARVTAEHKQALEKYLGSADSTNGDEYIHTMFVLIHLMKEIGHLKLNFESFSQQSKKSGHGHLDFSYNKSTTRKTGSSKALVHEVVLRCESAARQCNTSRGALWSTELRKMMYPEVGYSFLDS